MPLATSDTIVLQTARLRELVTVLTALFAAEGDLLVITEVGLNQGRDVYLGSAAVNVRLDAGRVVISADEQRQGEPRAL